MDDSAAALRPLDDARRDLARLDDYESPADLAEAVAAIAAAVERALRIRLRSDPSAPERDRLSALSAQELPLDDVVRSLRTRDLISLETAGTLHELKAAGARAHAGAPRAADADVARRAVARLREELGAGDRASVPPAQPADEPATGSDAELPPERRGRSMAWLGAGLAVVFLLAMAWVLTWGGENDYEAAVAMFRAGRLDSAAVAFEGVLRDRPEDVSTMLYLARIHRRQARFAEASEMLRRAAGTAPGDADVRRELGHLFMDLRQPRAAVRQYELALEAAPDETRTWAGLIRALRAAGDPRAERLLADAPADVQALLSRPDS